MKDQADTVTLDLPLSSKRGRPSTGHALTPAERKRAQRKRDRHVMGEAFSDHARIAEIPTTSLCEALACYVSSGFPRLASVVMTELARRSSLVDGDPSGTYRHTVTVTVESVRK
jgi:CRP-like cAMP-binding protein